MAKFKFEDLLYIKGRIGWQALSKNEYLKKGSYYLVTGIDIQNNNLINWDKCYFVSKERYEQDEKIQLKIGDIILTKDGTIGKIGYIDKLEKPATLNSHLFLIRNKREDILNTRYLFWLLQSNLFLKYTEGNSTGSNILGFTQKSIYNFEIELPDIKTQNNIANILDNINTQILRNNTMIQKLQDMILTRYSIMFQDKTNKNGLLKDICLLPSGYNFKPEIYNNYGEYKLITIKNVWDTFIDDINTDKISDVPSIKDYCYLRIGDILLSLTGNVGRISIVHSKNNLLNQRVSLLQAKENYKIYSYCLLKSQEYQFIMTNIARGTSQKNLSPIDVENLKIYVPTLEEIKVFNEKTENYFNEMLTIKQSTDKLIILKEKLLPLLINGQLNI